MDIFNPKLRFFSSQLVQITTELGSKQAVLVVLLVVFLLTLLWLRRKRTYTFHQPPGPRGLPIIGYVPFLGRNHHQKFLDLSKTYGPVIKWVGKRVAYPCLLSDALSSIIEETPFQIWPWHESLKADHEPPLYNSDFDGQLAHICDSGTKYYGKRKRGREKAWERERGQSLYTCKQHPGASVIAEFTRLYGLYTGCPT